MTQNTSNSQLLADLLGTRICHDLSNPLGAIGNGIELLEMSGLGDSPEMALIAESVANANARIRFFRIAFGGGSAAQSLGSDEIRGLLGSLASGGRIQYVWHADSHPSRNHVKLVFLVLQCLETAMPRGGTIEVFDDGGSWRIVATGDKLNVDPDLWSHFQAAQGRDLKPSEVQFALAPIAAGECGLDLRVDAGGEVVTVHAV